jgi:hypothetical protein
VLYRRRYLSPRAVKKVLGDAYFADAGRMIRDSHGHRLAEASSRATARKRTTSGVVIEQCSKYGAFGSQRRAATDGAKLGLQRSPVITTGHSGHRRVDGGRRDTFIPLGNSPRDALDVVPFSTVTNPTICEM